DQFSLTIGVTTQDKKVEEAMKANKAKMSAVYSALKEADLQEKEYQTSGFSISPQYSQPPFNPPREWRPELIGYEVSHTLNVRTTKLDHAGRIIDAVGKAGANVIKELSFTLQNGEQAHQEAITKAVQQARAYAEAAAKEAKIQLGDVMEL